MPASRFSSQFLSLFLVVLVFLAAALGIAVGAPADPASARLSGTVVDPDGGVVPGATIVLSLAGSGAVTAEARADDRGEFRFDAVSPGRYELRATSAGLRADPIAVQASGGEERRVRVTLHVSAVFESVVVSAAQVELPLSRASDSVTVLPASDLRALQAETVADAIRSVPGITVSRNGGRGSVTSVFPRGGESDYTAVFVDGVKANAFGGGYDFSSLSAADVERIEVVRGPQSALFGADAMGSVVQIVTKHGGHPRAEVLAEGGSFGTGHVSAGTWGSRRAWTWGASGERMSSSGFTGIAPATGTPVSNDDSLTEHGSFSGGWRGEGGADVRGTVNLTSTERGVPGPFGSNPLGNYIAVDTVSRNWTTTRQYGVRWAQAIGKGGRHVRQTASANWLDHANEFTYPDFASGFPTLSSSGTTRFDVRTQTDVDLSATAAASFGVEYLHERATSTFIVENGIDPVPIRRSVAGLFAEARYQPTAPLTVTAGVRGEWIERDALGQNPDPYSPRPAFGTDSQTSINPRVSAAFLVNGGRRGSVGWTRVHAAAGTGIRPPDAIEIAFTDNPSLQPERSRSVEAGVDQAIANERLVLAATLFHNRYDDLIVAVGGAIGQASRYRTDNISNATAKGVELSASARSGWGLSARAAYTFLDTEILAVDSVDGVAPAPFAVGDPLVRRPRHAGSLDVMLVRGPVSAFARLGSHSRSLDLEPMWGAFGGLFYNPGFTVVDAGASWRLVRQLEITGRVGNLFDRRYEEAYGYPALGRNVMIGVRVAAGR